MDMIKTPISFCIFVALVAIVCALGISVYRAGRKSTASTGAVTMPAEPGKERDAVGLLHVSTSGAPAQMEWERLSSDDLDTLTLRNLQGYPSFNNLFPSSDADLDRGQKWIDRHRAWAETLTDKRLRRAYVSWMDYFQHGLDENREENQTHAQKKSYDESMESARKERDRLQGIKIPRPPK